MPSDRLFIFLPIFFIVSFQKSSKTSQATQPEGHIHIRKKLFLQRKTTKETPFAPLSDDDSEEEATKEVGSSKFVQANVFFGGKYTQIKSITPNI